jgi:glycosyltransferase involved in cell wall biosynthesis
MATYNGAEYIQKQLESILVQLSKDDELIISDDGSTDETVAKIESCKDSRIRLVNHVPIKSFTGHEKVTANFENALKMAQGDIIFLTDQDDIWLDNKVPRCVDALRNADLVLHNMLILEEATDSKSVMFTKNPIPRFWFMNFYRMRFWGCAMAFRRNVLEASLPFPYRLIGHDYWLSTIALKLFRVRYVEEPLMIYRRHEGSVSYKKRNKFGFKVKYRIVLMRHVLKKGNKK